MSNNSRGANGGGNTRKTSSSIFIAVRRGGRLPFKAIGKHRPKCLVLCLRSPSSSRFPPFFQTFSAHYSLNGTTNKKSRSKSLPSTTKRK
uniref:Uncharacterized protein n=1 Tax=Globodera rostochiensis TaxID=31243 RepID=A0A914H5Z2_GLORO